MPLPSFVFDHCQPEGIDSQCQLSPWLQTWKFQPMLTDGTQWYLMNLISTDEFDDDQCLTWVLSDGHWVLVTKVWLMPTDVVAKKWTEFEQMVTKLWLRVTAVLPRTLGKLGNIFQHWLSLVDYPRVPLMPTSPLSRHQPRFPSITKYPRLKINYLSCYVF